MRRFPHGGEVLGASPANPLLAPVLRPELVLSRQQALLDQQAIQRLPGLAGYWPASPEYLFEDSAGTIPASVGGVVGNVSNLVPATYGPNLVTNGTFDTGTTGWTTYSGTIGQTSGELKLTNGASVPSENTIAYTSITTEIGAVYFVTALEHSEFANNAATIYAGTSIASDYISSAIGSYTVAGSPSQLLGIAFIATSTTTYITVGNRGLANATSYLDNVVARKILTGHMALQTTTANKPYLRKTPTSGVHWLDSNTSTSALTATLGNLGSACTVCQAGAEGVTFTEGVTISSTYNIAPAFGFNGDVAIFNRALTVTEKALLTRYMARGVPVLGTAMITAGNAVSWTPYGSNVVSQVGTNEISIAYGGGTTSSFGAWAKLTGTAISGPCLIFADFKVGSGNSVTPRIFNSAKSTLFNSITNTGYVKYSVVVTNITTPGNISIEDSLGSGESIYIRNITIQTIC